MTDLERRLLPVLKARSFRTGTFKLASGDTSSYYIDGRMSAVFSESAALIGDVLYERTQPLGVDAIGGLAVGAVPLATAAVISYQHHGRTMEGFWVRDAVKGHGTKKLVEGGVKPGDRVVVLEDVATRGLSAEKAVVALREMGCEVVQILALVDRLQGAGELFREKHGIDFRAVFSIRDFGVEVP